MIVLLYIVQRKNRKCHRKCHVILIIIVEAYFKLFRSC